MLESTELEKSSTRHHADETIINGCDDANGTNPKKGNHVECNHKKIVEDDVRVEKKKKETLPSIACAEAEARAEHFLIWWCKKKPEKHRFFELQSSIFDLPVQSTRVHDVFFIQKIRQWRFLLKLNDTIRCTCTFVSSTAPTYTSTLNVSYGAACCKVLNENDTLKTTYATVHRSCFSIL